MCTRIVEYGTCCKHWHIYSLASTHVSQTYTRRRLNGQLIVFKRRSKFKRLGPRLGFLVQRGIRLRLRRGILNGTHSISDKRTRLARAGHRPFRPPTSSHLPFGPLLVDGLQLAALLDSKECTAASASRFFVLTDSAVISGFEFEARKRRIFSPTTPQNRNEY